MLKSKGRVGGERGTGERRRKREGKQEMEKEGNEIKGEFEIKGRGREGGS